MDSNKLVSKCEHITDSNVTYFLSGKQVFRDQCSRCYEDPQSEDGLDVCLKCFQGNCKSELFNHSHMHQLQKNHPIILNIKEVLIKDEVEESSDHTQNITKLAIGKPGGADLLSNEKWEKWLRVHCLVCKVDIDYSKDSKLNDLVTSVINTSAAVEQSNIKEWELEILPCEHTLTLVQNQSVKIASKLEAKCNECNISSALWMCLTCGYLGCGRKNYDGTGGNEHAIAHKNLTKHPLVVKTGTITPEGDASIYCYSCDNDVKDSDLPLHLSNLGIDVSTQVKTEKTMTELNLDFNLNFTLSKTIEEGKVLIPIYGPGNTGLENLGNSCYMNSVIQTLFSLEPFQRLYYDNALEHLSTCFNDPHNCFYCQISKIFYGMYSGMYSTKRTRVVPKTEDKEETVEEYQKGIKPGSFKLFFNKDHPEFSSARQQDAFEYMVFLLDKFEKQELLNKRPNPKSFFEFELETRLECETCHCVKYKVQKSNYLILNIPEWQIKKTEETTCSFEEVIAKFLGEETVDLKCHQCQASTFVKTQRVKSFPTYLVIIFGRFVYDWVPVKLETQFIPTEDDFDLRVLGTNHSKVGEKVIVEEESKQNEIEEVEPEFDKNALNLLLSNGVPELAAKHALLNTENNPDLAISWYFENMDNPVISNPIPKIKKNKNIGMEITVSVPDDLIESVISIIGCSRKQAEGALTKCGNNPERAIDYILSHPDETFDDPQNEQLGGLIESQNVDLSDININNSPFYKIYGFITHLGANMSHGHYVCHLRKGNDWIYYNDSRVNISEEPPIRKGYIFIYKNKK